MISPVITAVFTIAYLVFTAFVVHSLKLNVRAICVGAVIIALPLPYLYKIIHKGDKA